MKTTLKKSLSLLLAIIITVSLAAPVFAAEEADTSCSISDIWFTRTDDTENTKITSGVSGVDYTISGKLGDGFINYIGQTVQIVTKSGVYPGTTTNIPVISNEKQVNNTTVYAAVVDEEGKFYFDFTAPDVTQKVTFTFQVKVYSKADSTKYLFNDTSTFEIAPDNLTGIFMYCNKEKITGGVDAAHPYIVNVGTKYTLTGKYTSDANISETDCGETTAWAKTGTVTISSTSGKETFFTPYADGQEFSISMTYTNGCGKNISTEKFFKSVQGPIISSPLTDTQYYYYRDDTTKPTLTVSSNTDEVTYQWNKIVEQDDGTDKLVAISGATSATFSPDNPSAGNTSSTRYCCIVSKNGGTTQSKTFTVDYIDKYKITVLPKDETVTVSEYITLAPTVTYQKISADHTEKTTPLVTSAETDTDANSNSISLVWTAASADAASASAVNVSLDLESGSAKIIRTAKDNIKVYGVKEKVTPVYVYCSVSGQEARTEAASSAITVTQIPNFSVSAAVPSNGAEFSMIATNSSTTSSVQDQIKTKFGTSPAVQYVVFESFTNEYGKLSTSSTLAKYYIDSAPTGQRLLSEVTYTPNGTPGEDKYVMKAFASDGTEKRVTLTITSSKNLTGKVDIAYNVKTGTTISIDEQDFIDWFLGLDSQLTSLKSVKFKDTPSHGSLIYGTALSKVGTGEYYTKDGAPSTSSNLLSNVKFKAGSTKGSDGIEFTATGTNAKKETVTKTGVVYFCVTSKDISDITYNVKYGTNISLSETDFNAVYKSATGLTSTQKFSVQFIKNPQYGTLYRYGTKSATYKVDAHSPVNLYVNQTGTERSESTYNLGDVIYVPIALSSGEITAKYAAYDTSGNLVYIGNVVFVYNGGDQKFTCGAEGYKFSVSDFVSSSDSDPIVSVSFTPLASSSSGKLYYDYANGKGTLITGIEKFSTTTGGTISSVVYIPRSQTPVNQDITYSATTKSGKSISATITIKYLNRTVSQKFTDVKDSWAIPGVDFCSAWGIANGTGGSTFTPAGTMQRCMLVAMLYRMAGSPNVSSSNPFKDVSVNDYYYAAVLWAYSKQIVTGTTATTFSPKAAVTRQDIATMLWRYAGCPTASASYLNKYTDASSVSSYAVQPMSWAVSQGIITGSGNKLTPTASGTRAQVAAMLHRYLA